MTRSRLAPIALLALLTGPALADDYTSALQSYMTSDILKWASDPVLLDAVRTQNAGTAAYDQAMIDQLDAQWRAELGSGNSALVTSVLINAASEFLRGQVAASGGKITEAFITDARGLNVAASGATSDYWQGDEDKFAKVFPNPRGHFISEVELDESTLLYQGQISVTIADPVTGEALGTLTVGVDAESL